MQKKLSREQKRNNELNQLIKKIYEDNVSGKLTDGVENLSADFRIGIDVMTTETTCLSSIWETDSAVKEFYEIHGRSGDYKELTPGDVAYYDGMIYVDLARIKPMIAMPFHQIGRAHV